MINLDEKYHHYLESGRTLKIDGCNEKLLGYGYHCDGNEIIGYYLTTANYKLFYNMNEQFLKLVPIREQSQPT